MTTVAEQMTEAQERMLTGMEAAQERMIEMNKRMAEAITGVMPKSDRFTVSSLPGMPDAEDLPKPEQMIDRYFDFTAKLAEANRAFYKEMVSAWAFPDSETEQAPKAAAKTTAKKTSK